MPARYCTATWYVVNAGRREPSTRSRPNGSATQREADAKIGVRFHRESDGRVRARFLTGRVPAPSAETGSSGEADLPGIAGGEAGWETAVALDVHRESGVAYRPGSVISESSCSVTVARDTRPPVPGATS